MIRIGMFFAEGFEEAEAIVPADMLRRAGIDVRLVSITGRKEVTGSHKITVTTDMLFDKKECESFDMLVLPGGMPGTVNLEKCGELCSLIREYADKNMPLAAICRAPTIFGHMGILKGRRACCYPGFENELEGAKVVTDMEAVSDGNIITSRGAGCAHAFALAIISRFMGEQKASEIARGIVYGENDS